MNTDAAVRLTQPSWGVVGLLLVYVFLAALLAAAAVGHPSPLALIPIIGFTSVLAQDGWLRAHVARRRVRDFRFGGSKGEYPGRAIRVVLEDGSTMVLVATGRYFAQAEHGGQLAEVQHGLRSSAPGS